MSIQKYAAIHLELFNKLKSAVKKMYVGKKISDVFEW